MSYGPGLDDLFPRLDKDTIAVLSSDVDEILTIARRGDNLPLEAGSVCAWWGLLLMLTNLYRALAQFGYVPDPVPLSLIQVPLGYLGTVVMMLRRRERRHLLAWRSQVISATWLFSGVAILIFMTGMMFAHQYTDVVANMFLSLLFALNFGVMGASRLTKWLVYPAGGWILVAVLTAIFAQSPGLLSIWFGLGACAFMLIPGIVLRLQERGRLK